MNDRTMQGKRALVLGASSGVGKATARALARAGAQVTGVARGTARLQEIAGERVETVAGDVTDGPFVERLMRPKPDVVVVSAGVVPAMGTVDDFSWESFSAPWNVDLKASFLVVQQALTLPLAPGSRLVLLSSGAAVNGSPLSGGYAGAKRMQWLMASYAQKVADARGLGIRVLAVLPLQLLEGTTIGMRAAATYGALSGTTAEAFMQRYDAPLDADKVADAILQSLGRDAPSGMSALAVKGTGVEYLP